MKYNVYVSGYLEETNQLLVSFSSDETGRDAKDYPSLAFDLISYGDIDPEQILLNIAKCAPTYCSDIYLAEKYEGNHERREEFLSFVGKTFEFDDSQFAEPSSALQNREASLSKEQESADSI